MSIFEEREGDLEPLREQILATSGVDPEVMAGFVVIICTSEGGQSGAGIISSSPNPRTIINVLDLVSTDLRQQIAAAQ